jgi:hypothetical protein
MGGVIQSSKDEYAAWTGGKPKADWSGLDPTGVTVMRVPTQVRPTYVSSSCKAYLHRVTGLVTKLAVSGADFRLFCTKVNDHLEDTGMDSISYLPDPHDRMNMISVVTNYSRFTLEYVISTWKGFKGLLDPYDQANNQAAIKFLRASVDAELDRLLHERMDVQDSFVVVWMRLVKLVVTSSVEKYDRIKERIKARLPSHYKGQDIIQLSQAFQEDARELALACQYDHNLTLKMLQIFISAGGDGLEAEDYRHPLRTKRDELRL